MARRLFFFSAIRFFRQTAPGLSSPQPQRLPKEIRRAHRASVFQRILSVPKKNGRNVCFSPVFDDCDHKYSAPLLPPQTKQDFYMADDYNSPQKCPFSDVETTKNLGYDSRQYLLGILYSILPPLSILSKTFILQWVKGENIHEKKGRPKDAFPLGRPCCFTSV